MEHIEWFEIIYDSLSLSQGDVFFSVPILIPPINPDDLNLESIPLKVQITNGVILSQTCDLEQGNIDMVLFCPIYPLDEIVALLANSNTSKAIASTKKQLWDGKYYAYHLLNKCELEDFKSDFFIVDLKNPRSLQIDFINNIVKLYPKRIRLKSPYKEALSQAFARVIMRVGIPDKKPEFQ